MADFDRILRIMPKEHNREKALAALLECSSLLEAAKTCGLSEKTLRRYLEDQEFADEYRNKRQQVVERAVAQLQQSTTAAVETLRRNLTCREPAAEIRAAQLILSNVLNTAENDKPAKEIVISFNFNNSVNLEP